MSHPDDPKTLAQRAESVLLWAIGIAWLMLGTTPITLLSRWLSTERLDPWTRLYTRSQVAVTTARWRAIVDPAVDPDQTYLFCQNHVNILDYCTMYPSTPHVKQGIELESHFKIPFYGWFMKGRGTIGINRDDPRALVKLIRACKAEVAKGRSLLMFPEGTRTRTGRVAAFETGAVHIARQLGLPIVPVAVLGMHEVQPTGSWRFRAFQEVVVEVMAPIPTAGLAREDVEALSARVRDQIAARVDAWYAERGETR
jgi:1-acyl-sn-glycerol-3-phosphate acyltransferase